MKDLGFNESGEIIQKNDRPSCFILTSSNEVVSFVNTVTNEVEYKIFDREG